MPRRQKRYRAAGVSLTRPIAQSPPIEPTAQSQTPRQKLKNVPAWRLRLHNGLVIIFIIAPQIALPAYMFQEELRERLEYPICVVSMISSRWSRGMDRVWSIIPPLRNITASNVSVAYIMFQDAAFVCAFAWFVLRLPSSRQEKVLIVSQDHLSLLADLHET